MTYSDPADIEYLNALVARVKVLREHADTVRRSSIASLQPPPNFVLVEAKPMFEDLDIPHPSSWVPPPKLSLGRIVAGSFGAAVCLVCAATSLMLLLVQT